MKKIQFKFGDRRTVNLLHGKAGMGRFKRV